MDVIKPETYWIDNRCYRRNPSRNGSIVKDNQRWNSNDTYVTDTASAGAIAIGSNQRQNSNPNPSSSGPGQLRPYVEEDDFGSDPDAPDELEDSEKYNLEEIENGFKTRCENIPASMFSRIVGQRGATKQRIEKETNTKIIIPRQNEQGDIVIRGHKRKDVISARRKLDMISSFARFKNDPTHFACFALNTPPIIEKVKEFKVQVLKECGFHVRGLDELVFVEAEKVHLTLCMLVLLDERERNMAKDILNKLQEEIRSQFNSANLVLELKGIEIMNDDPTEVDVLYAKCTAVGEGNQETIQSIADLIAKRFVESGFSKQFRSDNVKLHCTIMNTRKRAESKAGNNGNNKRETFDASLVLSKFKDFDFGKVDIKEVKLATRFTSGSDGFYKCSWSFPL